MWNCTLLKQIRNDVNTEIHVRFAVNRKMGQFLPICMLIFLSAQLTVKPRKFQFWPHPSGGEDAKTLSVVIFLMRDPCQVQLFSGPRVICTWKTVRKDPMNDSNLERLEGGWNLPPKSWVPSIEKMDMKRMRRTRRDTMADMESRRDLTRRDMDLQYLRKGVGIGWVGFWVIGYGWQPLSVSHSFPVAVHLDSSWQLEVEPHHQLAKIQLPITPSYYLNPRLPSSSLPLMSSL